MAPTSFLEIPDWREEKFCVNRTMPEKLGFFITDNNKCELAGGFDALRYLDKAELDVEKLHRKFSKTTIELPICQIKEPVARYASWRSKFLAQFNSEFATTRSILSMLMNTPFEINEAKRKWKIYARYEGTNKIFLYREENEIISEGLEKQYDRLKRYLFVRKPEYLHRQMIMVNQQYFYEVCRVVVGVNRVVYSSDNVGVISDDKVTKLDELKEVEHIYCDICETNEFPPEVMSYNPYWWSNAKLLSAKKCYIGVYNRRNDCLDDIINFTTDRFKDPTKFENQWSPIAAWNFLNLFLEFVKYEVFNIRINFRSQCVWKFESFENDNEGITCEPMVIESVDGEEKFTPGVPVNWFRYYLEPNKIESSN